MGSGNQGRGVTWNDLGSDGNSERQCWSAAHLQLAQVRHRWLEQRHCAVGPLLGRHAAGTEFRVSGFGFRVSLQSHRSFRKHSPMFSMQ